MLKIQDRCQQIRFKPPVILYNWSFQGNYSVVVPFVLCFVVEFLCYLNLM